MKIGIIYKSTNRVNGNIYIGKTIKSLKRRKQIHKTAALKNYNNSYFHNAIRKYGFDNFTWEILHQSTDENYLFILEKFYIKFYKINNKVYNMTYGGEGLSGHIPSEETLIKMRRNRPPSRKGVKYIMDEERKKNISLSQKGKIISEATKEKLRKANLGKRHSEETKRKMSLAQKGKVVSLETRKKIKLSWIIRKQKKIKIKEA